MIFNSLTYVYFLSLIVALYWLLPRTPRLWLIFVSSLIFYGFWSVKFLPILIFTIILDYVIAILIYNSSTKTSKRMFLVTGIVVNLGLLIYFKYLFFITDSVASFLTMLGSDVKFGGLKVILPIGISFYTFHAISYIVDVYRGFIKPERNFVLYSCFITYFVQLVAGPVLRAKEVMPQLSQPKSDMIDNLGVGIRRILYGLFLKVVIADNIAPLVDTGFQQSASMLSAFDVFTLAFLFGFQIYFDFSGYSHIAIGSARLMGIHFPENFNFPYLSISPKDFWQRWHISLSSWIRDYLYLPLNHACVYDHSTGGIPEAASEKNPLHKMLPLFITWMIIGFWHGAKWTFVLWGVYHALFIFMYRITSSINIGFSQKVRSICGWAITLFVVMFGWVFFRAESVSYALEMYGRLFDLNAYTWLGLRENTYLVATNMMIGVVAAYFIKTKLLPRLQNYHVIWVGIETAGFCVISALVIIFLRPIKQFIYFQF